MQNASRATANPRAMPTPVADVSVFENVIDRVAKAESLLKGRNIELMTVESKKPKDVNVSVNHTLVIKKIEEDADGLLWCYATMLQRIIGATLKERSKSYFEYRFNEMMPTDEHINARRTRYKEDENGIVTATTTFSCKFQLTGKPIYAKYPFMIFKYSAIVELSTFELQISNFAQTWCFTKTLSPRGNVAPFLRSRSI